MTPAIPTKTTTPPTTIPAIAPPDSVPSSFSPLELILLSEQVGS